MKKVEKESKEGGKEIKKLKKFNILLTFIGLSHIKCKTWSQKDNTFLWNAAEQMLKYVKYVNNFVNFK